MAYLAIWTAFGQSGDLKIRGSQPVAQDVKGNDFNTCGGQSKGPRAVPITHLHC